MKMKLTKESNRWVPKKYKIDSEFNCLGNSEALAKMVPELTLVIGLTRFIRKGGIWGEHQWCMAPDGTIVDPYFMNLWPNDWQNIEYKVDNRVFV